MAYTYCKNCGALVDDADGICSKCGSSLYMAETADVQSDQGQSAGFQNESGQAADPFSYENNSNMNGMNNNAYAGNMNGMNNNAYAGNMNGMNNNAYAENMNGMNNNAYAGNMNGMNNNAYAGNMNGMNNNAYAGNVNGMNNNAYAENMNGMNNNAYAGNMNGMNTSAYAGNMNYYQTKPVPVRKGPGALKTFFVVLLCIFLFFALIHLVNSITVQSMISPDGLKALFIATGEDEDYLVDEMADAIEMEIGINVLEDFGDKKEFEKLVLGQFSHMVRYILTDDYDEGIDTKAFMQYFEKHIDDIEDLTDGEISEDNLEELEDVLETLNEEISEQVKEELMDDLGDDDEAMGIYNLIKMFMSYKNIYMTIGIICILIIAIFLVFIGFYGDSCVAVGISGIISSILSSLGIGFIWLVSVNVDEELAGFIGYWGKNVMIVTAIIFVVSILLIIVGNIIKKKAVK